MEFINKIELCGYVGNVRLTNISGHKSLTFSLVVEQVYENPRGLPIVNSTWFQCVAFEGEKIKDLDKVEKNTPVHITGRMKAERYMDNQGEKIIYSVLCNSLKIEQ